MPSLVDGVHGERGADAGDRPDRPGQSAGDAYHVAGTANSLSDPVADDTAAADYAAHRYGSVDEKTSRTNGPP
ncbi:hypothetical protein [Streptomyces sp. NRRL B-3648]|uniref:hypothetical protein n=1 Tax=Streptomyces sp. NRRL B-3648 TaxID=1519493 RepID=UPI0006B03337|nr:hypothetical protein [Streptomyces sp. NRRL B-3648]KOX11496.1 hypothetical protein ADL04_00945 [Streptomyces sp. NRRL B-3648]